MNYFSHIQAGQQSTYGSDYKSPDHHPLRLFRLQKEPSHTTHQKIAGLWAQYNRLCFKTSISYPQNSASTESGRTMTATMSERERENFNKIHVERTALPEKGLSQAHCLSPDPGEGRSDSPSLHRTFAPRSEPSHSGPSQREAWTQVTVDPALGVADKAEPGVELPQISSGEESPRVEGLRTKECRRDMTYFSRLEAKINQRFATNSALMRRGLPFDGVTTYSQSYAHWASPPFLRGPQRILPETTVNCRAWTSEYQERYQRPECSVPGKRKPPTCLKTNTCLSTSGSQASAGPTAQVQGHIRSEYQRHYTLKGYPCLSRPKTSRPKKDH